MEFKAFRDRIEKQFDKMAQAERLYRVDIDKEAMWEHYLASFPEGTNDIFRERRVFDCRQCRHFVRRIGNVVAIGENGELISVWDIAAKGFFKVVAARLSTRVKNAPIIARFSHDEPRVGIAFNVEPETMITWHHMSAAIADRFRISASETAATRTNAQVFERGLTELSPQSGQIVLELIEQNSLYRGAEFRPVAGAFVALQRDYRRLRSDRERNIYVWRHADHPAAVIRNTAIGTLLQDLSEGVDINGAVAAFESKVAPDSYKRSSAPITKAMVDNAVATLRDLGLEPALDRRFATIRDVSINNVLFADRSVSALMKDALTDLLMDEVKPTMSLDLKKVEVVPIEDFITRVLPGADALEVLVENKHQNNFMSLTAPQHPDVAPIFQWDNNFAWSYNGNVTDSLKQRVKNAGGNVDGILRISLAWFNFDDLDLHVIEPNGNRIHFLSKSSETSGKLDVDMNVSADTRAAVENITWSDARKMLRGTYQIVVHNYTHRERVDVGFEIEVEYGGVVTTFSYDQMVRANEHVPVASFNYDATAIDFIKVHPSVKHGGAATTIWGVTTQAFRKVPNVLLSPNHWDDNGKGNKHYLLILDGCKNPEPARGFYNEFLRGDLQEHRKVFEVLADKMKCPPADEQLSGLGFSSTQRADLVCRVRGSFNRTLRITF